MAAKGMDGIFISVSNLEDSMAFYRDFVGMKVVAEQALEPDEIQQLWDLPAGTTARTAFLKIELQSTLLELIEFTPHSGKTIREGAKVVDYGLYDVAFLVKDIDKIYRDLTEKGFTFISPPIQYQPIFIPYQVRQVFLSGPDNVPITFIERMTPQEQESPGYSIRFSDSAQTVDNIDEAIKFYCDILGLDLLNQVTCPKGFLDDLLGLPPGSDVKLAFINKKDTDAVMAEFLQLSVKGKSLASIARPPNLGLFMISFEVDALSSLMETFKKEGIAILSGPVELHTKLHGKMRAITVEGPGGAMIELFER